MGCPSIHVIVDGGHSCMGACGSTPPDAGGLTVWNDSCYSNEAWA